MLNSLRKTRGMMMVAVVGVAILIVSCGKQTDENGSADRQSAGELTVFADIPPVAFLVEEIGGEQVDVKTLVPSKVDPHVFEPTPRQIVELSKARIYFSSDMPFDRQIRAKIGATDKRLTIVDTAAGIKKRASACGPQCTHGHDHAGHAHNHESENISGDPHVWLSPALLKEMAGNIAAALQESDPAHADEYGANLERLSKRIDETDQIVAQRLEPYRGRAFYVFHPAFGYLAEAYGLKQKAVQIEGREPSPKHLVELVEEAKADRISVVFVQGQFDHRAAQTVAEAIGAKLVTIDPLAKDVLGNLDELSKKVVEAMRGGMSN